MHLFIVTSKLNVFEQGAKTCGSGFCLRKFESLFFDFFCGYIVQGFHAQTQFSVFDRSDLDFYSITFGQNSCRCFDTFFADLRNVQQTGQAISKVDKCTVRFDGLYGSFGNESDLNVGNFCFAFFICFLTQDLSCGKDETFVFSISIDDTDFQFFAEPVVQSVFFYIVQESLDAGMKPRMPSRYATTPDFTMPPTLTVRLVPSSMYF